MIKKIAWETFKNTGDIDTFLEFKQIENIENNIKEIQNITNMNLKNKNNEIGKDISKKDVKKCQVQK